jgi:hypothetical protein
VEPFAVSVMSAAQPDDVSKSMVHDGVVPESLVLPVVRRSAQAGGSREVARG